MIKLTEQTELLASDRQVRIIGLLCMRLRIKEEYEQKQMTMAEAGYLIRNLLCRIKQRSLR